MNFGLSLCSTESKLMGIFFNIYEFTISNIEYVRLFPNTLYMPQCVPPQTAGHFFPAVDYNIMSVSSLRCTQWMLLGVLFGVRQNEIRPVLQASSLAEYLLHALFGT